jgi:hypothetical protein
MPEHLRGELSSRSFGLILLGTPEENVRSVLEIVRSTRPPKVIIVGDFTLKAFLGSGFRPDLGIFDRKTGRAVFDFPEEGLSETINPPGRITDEAIFRIKELLSSDHSSLLFVKGEEDLLSLPSILYSPEGSLVIYGIPSEGMMVVTADRNSKEKIKGILKQFKRVG